MKIKEVEWKLEQSGTTNGWQQRDAGEFVEETEEK